MPYFQNAAEATQFSGSRPFQVCLPTPSSSCLFLPTAFRLALVVRLYLPLLTKPACSMLSLLFFSGHFENSLTFSSLIARSVKKSVKKTYFPWDFIINKIKNSFPKIKTTTSKPTTTVTRSTWWDDASMPPLCCLYSQATSHRTSLKLQCPNR